ncbi:hypothetical protein [Synechococcus sp. PCC 7336]|uniref:hypothetical protein n=1 Tax=Synechococcus sp. PCC 7336 TaxID=195250 RepID=UPI000344F9BA|nr:hypothetical protein [Synechococcus sp. PCC 7336]
MAIVSAIYGAFLTALGAIGYFASGQASKTALIPCAFGIPILLLAIAAWPKPKFPKKLLAAAIGIAVLAFLGTASGLPGALTLLTGGDVERVPAVVSKAVVAIVSLAYTIYAVASLVRQPQEA